MNDESRGAALTPTESRVLDYIGQGKTTKEIAQLLGRSVLTVGNHRRSIARKLNLHSTAELAAYGAIARPSHDRCALHFRFMQGGCAIEISYAGPLRTSGGAATVSIGNNIFRF